MNATKVNAGPAESNGRLLLAIWRDSLHVTCGLTACTPGSAPGPTLGNEYGKTLPFSHKQISHALNTMVPTMLCEQKLILYSSSFTKLVCCVALPFSHTQTVFQKRRHLSHKVSLLIISQPIFRFFYSQTNVVISDKLVYKVQYLHI